MGGVVAGTSLRLLSQTTPRRIHGQQTAGPWVLMGTPLSAVCEHQTDYRVLLKLAMGGNLYKCIGNSNSFNIYSNIPLNYINLFC